MHLSILGEIIYNYSSSSATIFKTPGTWVLPIEEFINSQKLLTFNIFVYIYIPINFYQSLN